MKTLIDIGDEQIQALDALAREGKCSRVALIRDAIDDYLVKHRRDTEQDGFGLWGKRKIDGLAYQERIRGEW